MTRRFLVLMVLLAGIVSVRPSTAVECYRAIPAKVGMTDGIRLDVTMYLPNPEPASPVPLLVRQHGGGSNKDSAYDVAYGLKAVCTGKFSMLMYSHRGHGNSEGLFDFFGERTTKDFSELLDWVDAKFDLADSDNVGTWGYSQGGGESLLPAEADSRVRAVAVGNTFDDLNHALNPNDCFKFSFATGIFALAYKQSASKTDDSIAIRWGAQWNTDTEDTAIPPLPSTTAEAFDHSPLAHLEPAAGTYDTGLKVPVFWSNSWEDSLFPADHPNTILDHLKPQGIPTHLWFASGGHEVLGGDDPADQAGKEQAMMEWFEEFLLGEDHGYRSTDASPRPPVDYAQRVPGTASSWTHKTATAWPIPAAATHSIALNTGSIVNDLASADIATEPISYNRSGAAFAAVPDATDPVTSISTIEHLDAPIESTGAAHATIKYATTATRVAQFDVQVFETTSGGDRLVERGCFSDETPGDGLAEFDLWPNSHVFSAGGSIHVVVSAVDFPTFKPDTEPQQTAILPGSTLTLTGVAA